MSRLLSSLGRFAARRPLITIAAWLVLAAVVITASATLGRALDESFGVPDTDSQRAIELLDGAGAGEAGLSAQVVVTPLREGATFASDGAARAAARELRDDLAALPNVLAASQPAETLSPDGRVAIVRLQYPVIEELGAADLDRLQGAVAAARAGAPGRALQIEAGGDLFFAFEEPETGLGELAGIAAAAIILLVAFGSLVAAGLPILLALFGLAVGVSAMPLVNHVIEVPSWAPMMAAMVGLGVGIDYALLLVSRHREHLAQGIPVADSIGRAVATAGRAVVFAGGTVLVSILGLAVAGIPFVTAAGVAISVVVLLMVSAAVTLLPALLALAGPWIDRLRIPTRRPVSGVAGARAERWATHVTRHPLAYLLAAAALLVALAAPVLGLRLGNPDEGTLAESRTERRAYDLVAAGLGPGANGPFLVAADISSDPGVVTRLRARLAADPGIGAVDAPRVDRDAGVATILATPTTAPQDAATRATLERLRGRVIPAATEGTGTTAHVGGQTAVFLDVSERVGDRLPAFIAAVVGLSVLLLVAVFRSIVIALKAAVLNLLSIGAAFGVVVMVFQWGWGASLIGLESAVPIVSFIPMFMFAVLFGLSMDYEVFLLSRIREHYLASGDNDAAIVRGLATTTRVITAAALIMVAVFAGFVAGSDPTTKMFGLGMATAIALDATLVRMVLLPASMTLLGRANWWLPGWLDRLVPGAGRAHGATGAVVTAVPVDSAPPSR